MSILEIKGLKKSYIRKTPCFCAEIPHLIICPGQVLGITGRSGCGKSTLLELLAVLVQPDQADLYILHGKHQTYDVKALWSSHPGQLSHLLRWELGFVHQAGGLYPFLSCRENIALPLLLQCVQKEQRDALVNNMLDFLELEHVAERLPEQLSYGERQRTAIARALIHKPCLLLADEPTSSLDPDSAKKAMQLLCAGAKHTGSSLLVVSHDHALLETCGIPTIRMKLVNDSDDNLRHYSLEAPEPSESESIAEVIEHKDGTKSPVSAPWWLTLYLACRDFLHEYTLSICAILAFAAALTPILVLGGLRSGIVTTLTQRFLNNPSALAIYPYSATRYTDEDINKLAHLANVAFIVPQTRSLAATVLISRQDRPPIAADIVPTAESDPLLLRYARIPKEGEVVITQELARSLTKAEIGQKITISVTRRVKGRDEHVELQVRIIGILPDAADWKAHLYLPVNILVAIEHYRDGFSVPERNWPGQKMPDQQKESYAGFRMYVTNPDAVVVMRDTLKELGIEAWTSAREVETIQGLERALSLITVLVGCVTLIGVALSLASLAISNIRRKARLIAQAYLIGLRRHEILTIPLFQMAFISFLAATCSLIFYVIVAHILNLVADPWLLEGELACHLEIVHFLILYAGSFLVSCGCGIFASFSLLSLQPAEVLRREN